MIARLEKLFFLMLALCPFAMGATYAVINMAGGWSRFIDGHDYAFYCLKALYNSHFPISFLICGLTWFLLWRFCKGTRLDRLSTKGLLLCLAGVFALAVAFRLGFLLALGRGMANTMDPGEAWLRAGGTLHGVDVRVTHWGRYCPWWMYYALLMKGFIGVFGDRFTLFMALQTVFGGVTAVALFLLAREVSGSVRVALFSSLLYAANPSGIVYYTAVANPEHVAVAFHVLGAWLAVRLINGLVEMGRVSFFMNTIAWSLAISIGDAFKPFFPIFIIAFLIAGFFVMASSKGVCCRRLGVRLLTAAVLCVVLRCVVLSLFALSSRLAFGISPSIIEAAPHNISVGLERGAEGQVFLSRIGVRYFKLLDAGVEREVAAQEVKGKVLDDWSGHWRECLPFVAKKTIWTWQDDCCAFYYYRYNRERGGISPARADMVRRLVEYGSSISLVWYLFAMAAAFLSAIGIAAGVNSPRKGSFFIGLLIFGFFCMMLVSESTMRYKYIVVPYIIVFVSGGVRDMTLFSAWCRILDFTNGISAKVVRRYQTRMALRCAESCGTGLKVNHPSRFLSRCRFGNNCNFNGMTVLGRGRVTFGDNFHSGENCRIITSNHNYDGGRAIPYDDTNIEKEIVFGDNVWLGDSVVVVGNVTVGEGAIVGAGSVVCKDVPSLAIVGGNPAKVLKYRDRDHYHKLKAEGRFC